MLKDWGKSMKPIRKRWSDEEIQYLRDNADNKFLREIASDLGRTYRSVNIEASRLKIRYFIHKSKPVRDDLTSQELAYFAGLMDGEGCIYMYRNQTKIGNYYIIWGINITNTNSTLIQWLCDNLGGTMECNGKTKAGNLVWVWRTWTKAAYKLLKLALPYLVIKSCQAKLAIEFQDNRHPPGYYNRYNLKEEEQKLLEINYVSRMANLKKETKTCV